MTDEWSRPHGAGMTVASRHYRSIWVERGSLRVIDRTRLPHEFAAVDPEALDHPVTAIRQM